jgi:hypothetical protein
VDLCVLRDVDIESQESIAYRVETPPRSVIQFSHTQPAAVPKLYDDPLCEFRAFSQGDSMPAHHPHKAKQFPWQKVYKAAALEADKTRLVDRIETAEGTLMARFLELSNREEAEVEINALEKAIKTIRILKKKRLGFE